MRGKRCVIGRNRKAVSLVFLYVICYSIRDEIKRECGENDERRRALWIT